MSAYSTQEIRDWLIANNQWSAARGFYGNANTVYQAAQHFGVSAEELDAAMILPAGTVAEFLRVHGFPPLVPPRAPVGPRPDGGGLPISPVRPAPVPNRTPGDIITNAAGQWIVMPDGTLAPYHPTQPVPTRPVTGGSPAPSPAPAPAPSPSTTPHPPITVTEVTPRPRSHTRTDPGPNPAFNPHNLPPGFLAPSTTTTTPAHTPSGSVPPVQVFSPSNLPGAVIDYATPPSLPGGAGGGGGMSPGGPGSGGASSGDSLIPGVSNTVLGVGLLGAAALLLTRKR